IVFSWWLSRSMATPGGDQMAALFGNFSIGWSGYAGVVIVVLIVGALTAATSHVTVIAHLGDIEERQTDGSWRPLVQYTLWGNGLTQARGAAEPYQRPQFRVNHWHHERAGFVRNGKRQGRG